MTDRATQGTEATVLGQYKQESCQHGVGGADLQGVNLGSVALLGTGTGALVWRVCQSFVTI